MSPVKTACLWFISAIVVTAIGSIFVGCSFIDTRKCTVESFDHSNCYERNGKLFLERYYRLNNSTRMGLVLCGVVLDCDTSPCYNDVIIGHDYYCHWWSIIFDTMATDIVNGFFMYLLVIGSIVSFVGVSMLIYAITYLWPKHHGQYENIEASY